MEDYILREIDKIGKLIEALLQKAGILRYYGCSYHDIYAGSCHLQHGRYLFHWSDTGSTAG